MIIDEEMLQETQKCFDLLVKHKVKIAAAESCTGGLLTACLTAISGSSQILDRGFVTYSNEAKVELLGVNKQDIDKFGAVSKEVAYAMASGALKKSYADIAIGITGIAGPAHDGEKPVGLVYIGYASATNINTEKYHFNGSRNNIRKYTIIAALRLINSVL